MLPGAINFTRPGLSATFNDGGGINLNSSSTLSLNAGYVGLFAGDITIHGESKVVAQKGGSFISLEGEFFNDAGIVMENGSDRASNSNFTDDDPQNGVAEAKAALEAQMNEAALVDANEGALGTIADLSDKPLVQLEDVNSLPEYKVGMNAPDGTRMRAVGLDGKNYPGTLYNKNGVITFAPDNAKGYKKATSLNWDYIKTLGCSLGDMVVEGGIDLAKIPSKLSLKIYFDQI